MCGRVWIILFTHALKYVLQSQMKVKCCMTGVIDHDNKNVIFITWNASFDLNDSIDSQKNSIHLAVCLT